MGDVPENTKNNSPEEGSGRMYQDELILQQQRQIEREVKLAYKQKSEVMSPYHFFFADFRKYSPGGWFRAGNVTR